MNSRSSVPCVDSYRFGWVGAACMALWAVPTPRLRYVRLTARLAKGREEVGGLFAFEDAVTEVDREVAAVFDTEIVSNVEVGDPWSLDMSPILLPATEPLTVGSDDFIVYARAGETDPTGNDWLWDDEFGDGLSPHSVQAATMLALRGLVPPELKEVAVRTTPPSVDVRLVVDASGRGSIEEIAGALRERLRHMLLGAATVDTRVVSEVSAGLPNDRTSWLLVYRCGPPPWVQDDYGT